MPDDEAPPTPDQLKNWLTPREAVAMLDLSSSMARRAIANRLQDGLMRAAAHTVAGSARPRECIEIAPAAWKDWDYDAEPLFWSNGDCEFYRQGSSGFGSYPSGLRAYGVRFHPEGVRRLLEHEHPKGMAPGLFDKLMGADPSPLLEDFALQQAHVASQTRKAPPKARAAGEKVPTKELHAWYRTQFATDPGLTFGELHAVASKHFKPRRVTRQPLRDIIGEMGHAGTRGNPAFRRK